MSRFGSSSSRSFRFRRAVEKLLAGTDIEINGSREWDIRVLDDRVFRRILAEGSLGFGESYMEGLWECDRLDEFFFRLFSASVDRKIVTPSIVMDALYAKLINSQSPARSFKVGKVHYDLGNRLYERMLDKRMIYSCGYWKNASTLDQAQEDKLELICRKLKLEAGMRVLDVGCGWGGTARYIAEEYGCSVVGVTVSREQYRYAQELCRGFPVEIRLSDYRNLDESFDRIVSVGMFEHVGARNYPTFMKVVSRNLRDDGLFVAPFYRRESLGQPGQSLD